MNRLSIYQQNQIEVINEVERQVNLGAPKFSTVSPTDNYADDSRISLTSVHSPHKDLIEKVEETIIQPLKDSTPDYYYYDENSFHMTIKNVRIISDPPNFNEEDIEKVRGIFSQVIPRHKKFNVYFYRLLMFPHNLALIGTTDPELDEIFFDLDENLKKAGIADDKIYTNDRYFFSSMTLVRFTKPLTIEFKERIEKLSQSLSFEPYIADSVSLVTCNAAFKKLAIIDSWRLS